MCTSILHDISLCQPLINRLPHTSFELYELAPVGGLFRRPSGRDYLKENADRRGKFEKNYFPESNFIMKEIADTKRKFDQKRAKPSSSLNWKRKFEQNTRTEPSSTMKEIVDRKRKFERTPGRN